LGLSNGGEQVGHRRRLGAVAGPGGGRWYDKAVRRHRSRGQQASGSEEARLERTRGRAGASEKGARDVM
jgi:hypothetical protein